jgi:hypothetical protein
VLVDVLNSVASSKSPEQIGEFVKGGAVQLLIEAINTKGISLDGTFHITFSRCIICILQSLLHIYILHYF